ncbi:adhesion G-protein coupled receptor G4 isoform X2 [Hydra vulgaris]|uniref:adhesion G-protein coupled receptor G4 isoform X2 n=1 Tax=Hydra vulgaris TaxID=6087 RepID=UPI0032EA5191
MFDDSIFVIKVLWNESSLAWLSSTYFLNDFANTECPTDCTCSNGNGTIKRFCSFGFYFNATSGACQDINECLINCKYDQSICTNYIGSFNCSCPKGSVYNLLVQDCVAISTLSSFVTSTTIVSSFNNSFINQTTPRLSSFVPSTTVSSFNNSFVNQSCLADCTCSNGTIQRFCSFGFYFNATLSTCQDINECLTNCKYNQSICINLNGSFNCSCPKGSIYNFQIRDCAAFSMIQSSYSIKVVPSGYLSSLDTLSSTVVLSNYSIKKVSPSGYLSSLDTLSSTAVLSNYSIKKVSPSGYLSSLDTLSSTAVLSNYSIKKVSPSGYLSSLDTLTSTVVLSNYSIKKVTLSGYLSFLDTLPSTVVLSNYSIKKMTPSSYLSSLDTLTSTVVLSSYRIKDLTPSSFSSLNTSTSTVVLSSLSIPLLKQTSTIIQLNSSVKNNKTFQINESSSIIKNVATSTLIQSSFSLFVEQKEQSSFIVKNVVSSGHLNLLEIATSRIIQSSLPLVARTSAPVIQLFSSTVHVDKMQTGFSIKNMVSSNHLNALNITTSTVIYSSFNQSFVKQSYCKEETIGSVNFTGLYTFPVTHVNIYSTQTVSIPCVYNTSIMLNRQCIQSDPASSPYWSTVNLYTCPSKTETSQLLIKLQLTNITSSNAQPIASNLKNVLENGIVTNEYDVYIVSNIIKNIIKPSSLLSEMVTNDVLSSVDIILGVSPHIIDVANKVFNSSSQYLSSLDMLAMQQTKNITISKTNLAFLTYFPLTLSSLYIYANPAVNNINLSITDKDLRLSLENLQAHIFLPVQVFKGNTGNVYSYVFKQGLFFKEQVSTNRSVISWILSATVNGLKIENSTVPVEMSFPSNSSGLKECSFWRSESSIWSSDGCHNVNSNQTSYVQCECNHLTNFALILDTDQSGNNPLALQIVTWIGCSISIAGLFITIICHLFFRKYQTQLAPRILIALSSNLMITLIIFLALVERTKPRILCQVVASLIQFFLLSTFCWMVVEGFNLYRMFVKVFHNSASLNVFMLKAFAFAWGIPLIITVTTAVVKPDALGPATNDDPPICVVRGYVFYYAVLLPACIVILSNFIVLFVVQNGIVRCAKLMHGSKSKKRKGFANVRIAFGFTILLGTTWVFAILAVGSLRDLFQWLFCIFNSLQGLFIFIFYTLRSKEVKEYWSSFFGNKSVNTSTHSTLDMTTFSETSSRLENVSTKSKYSRKSKHQ